jgi:hypothetical protein
LTLAVHPLQLEEIKPNVMQALKNVEKKVVLDVLQHSGFLPRIALDPVSSVEIMELHNKRCNVSMLIFIKEDAVTAISVKVDHCVFPEEELLSVELIEATAINKCAA